MNLSKEKPSKNIIDKRRRRPDDDTPTPKPVAVVKKRKDEGALTAVIRRLTKRKAK